MATNVILQEVEIARAFWDPTGDNVDLGDTNGSSSLKYTCNYTPVNVEGKGNTVIKHFSNGVEDATLEIPFAQVTPDILNKMIPNSVLADPNLIIRNDVGRNMYDYAKTLVLKPLIDNQISATTTDWWYFYKVAPRPTFEKIFSKGEQTVWLVTFHIYPSQDSATEDYMWRTGK